MQVRVVGRADGFAIEAPVAPNHNHLDTAFGGSINAVATLAGYTLLWFAMQGSGAELLVRESSIVFLRPVTEVIRAVCEPVSDAEIATFKAEAITTGKAQIALRVRVEDAGAVAAEFRGTFLATRTAASAMSRAIGRESDDGPELPLARQ